ncbi:MAG: hypothetical protein SOZ34_09145 [Clostridia bacterium]|nr:hypothetical protein [Clostridia bacterium]
MKSLNKLFSLCLAVVMLFSCLTAKAESVTITNAANYEYASMTKWLTYNGNQMYLSANGIGSIKGSQKQVAFAYLDTTEIMKNNPQSITFKATAYKSGTANVYKVDITDTVMEAINATSNETNVMYYANPTHASYTEEAATLFDKYTNIYNNAAQYTAVKSNLAFVDGEAVEDIELKNLVDENGRVLLMFVDANPSNTTAFGFAAGDDSYVAVSYAEGSEPQTSYDVSELTAYNVDTDMIQLVSASLTAPNSNNKIGKNTFSFSINTNNNQNGFIQADLAEFADVKDYVRKVYLKMTVITPGAALLKLKKAPWRDISAYEDNMSYVYKSTDPTLTKEEFLSWTAMMNKVGDTISLFNCPTTAGDIYIDVTDYALSCIAGDGKISTAVAFFNDKTATQLGTKLRNTAPQFIVYVDDAAINAEKESRYLSLINAAVTAEDIKTLVEAEMVNMGGEIIPIKNHDKVYESMTGITYESVAQFIGKYSELCNAYIKPVEIAYSYTGYSNRDASKVSAGTDNLAFYTQSRKYQLSDTRAAVFVYDISEVEAADIYKAEYQHNGLNNAIQESTDKVTAKVYTIADEDPISLYTYEDEKGKIQTQIYYGAENDTVIAAREDKAALVAWYNSFVDRYINSNNLVGTDYTVDITNDFKNAVESGKKSYTAVLKRDSTNVKFYTDSVYDNVEVEPVKLVVYYDISDKTETDTNTVPYEIISINDCNDLAGTEVSGNEPFYYCGSVTVKKNTDEYNNPTIIIAAYRDGKLENVMSKNVDLSTVAKGANTDISLDAEMRAVGYWDACPDVVKAFVIDDFTVLKPISVSFTKNHNEITHYNGSHE